MLHLSHYYACYYALLFLLYQQQQQAASSLTVIIDGATTSEWATRDQYKRIVEQQQQHHHQQQQHHNQRHPQNHDAHLGSPFLELPAEAALSEPLMLEEQQEAQDADNNGNNRQAFMEEPYQQQKPEDGSEAATGVQQQQRARHHQLMVDDSASWLMNAAGARSLEDLATSGDRAEDGNELLIGETNSQPRIRGRESQLRKYCGYQLMDVLELVCQGRYYGGQPEVVEPSIKSRRSSHSRALRQHQIPAAGSSKLLIDIQPENTVAMMASKDGTSKPVELEKGLSRNRQSRKVLYRRIREEALWRGVTKECCDNPCRMEDLKNYCQPS